MDKGTINREKAFRIYLSSIVATELLDAPWMENATDAKAIADICVSQASAALSRTVAGSPDSEAAIDKLSSLSPQLVQHVSHSILKASIMIHRSLMKHYEQIKTN